jgi:hypothetical protein
MISLDPLREQRPGYLIRWESILSEEDYHLFIYISPIQGGRYFLSDFFTGGLHSICHIDKSNSGNIGRQLASALMQQNDSPSFST